jgi:UDP-N-acetylmuramate: L-alanyl-gamma-D-glutamyl-meso-diaminopimelate ligase
LGQYAHKLDTADVAIVYYNPHTLAHKRLEPIEPDDVKKAFHRENLHVFTDQEALLKFLLSKKWENKNLLMMSSGTFGGLDLKGLATKIIT